MVSHKTFPLFLLGVHGLLQWKLTSFFNEDIVVFFPQTKTTISPLKILFHLLYDPVHITYTRIIT